MSALDDLQAVIFKWTDRLSVIIPKLNRSKSAWWRVELVEQSDDDSVWYNQYLDERISWMDKKLKDWPNCKRMAHNMWDFKHYRDAEKFITLYHLSWQQ